MAAMCQQFTTPARKRSSISGPARPGLFLGEHGAAFQPHQLRRPQTLSQRGRDRGSGRSAIRSRCWKEQSDRRRRHSRRRNTRSSTTKSKSGFGRNSPRRNASRIRRPTNWNCEVTGKLPQLDDEVLPPGKYRIGDTVNKTLRAGLNERLAPHHFRRRRRRSERRRLSSHPKAFDRISRTGFQFAAGRIDHSGRRLRSGLVRQTAGLRVAVHRFHRPGLGTSS